MEIDLFDFWSGFFKIFWPTVPFRIGASRPNILMGPTPAYWPSAISRKNMGKPAQTNIITYDIYNKK